MKLCHQFLVAEFVLCLSVFSTDAQAVAPMLAAGEYHSVALKSDGTVVAWGRNGSGELGDGSSINRSTPVVVPGLTGVIRVTTGTQQSFALKSDGTLVAWGANAYGQLGDRTIIDRHNPTAILFLSDVVGVAAGYSHTVVLKSDGTVEAWGSGTNGELGDSLNNERHNPYRVAGLTGAVAVTAGYSHSVALKSDGTLVAWGKNNSGQLGDGTSANRSIPTLVSGLTGVVAIAAGTEHSVALKSDGTVFSWGSNLYGQLGDGTKTSRTRPVAVTGLADVIAVAAGSNHTLALKSDGTLVAWGRNLSGQLGDGSTTDRASPIAVSGLNGVVAVAGGGSHSVALKTDGTLVTWGNNSNSQLGNGSSIQASGLASVTGLNLGASAIPARPVRFGITLAKAGTHGITATINPRPWEIGSPLSVWLAGTFGTNLYLRGTGLKEWTPYQGGALPVARQVSAMPSSLSVDVIADDLSSLAGMDIYAAYGDLTKADHAAKILTVAKRTSILFSNPASPILFSGYAPLGQGITIRRRDASGVAKLGVVDADGSYSQFTWSSAGLTGMTIAGYQITTLSQDANGNAASASVKDPGGVVTTYSNLAAVQRSAQTNVHKSSKTCGEFDFVCPLENELQDKYDEIVAKLKAKVKSYCDSIWLKIPGVSRLKDPMDCQKADDSIGQAEENVKKVNETVNPATTANKIDEEFKKILVTNNMPASTSDSNESDDKAWAQETKKIGYNPSDETLAAARGYQFTLLDGTLPNRPICDVTQHADTNSQCVCNAADQQMNANGVCVAATSTSTTFTSTTSTTSTSTASTSTTIASATTTSTPVPNSATIISVSPTRANLNQLTTLTITGTGLTSGMSFTLESCSVITELPGGTSTQRQFTCTMIASGPKEGFIKDQPGGTTLYIFHVQAGASNLVPNTLTFSKPLSGGATVVPVSPTSSDGLLGYLSSPAYEGATKTVDTIFIRVSHDDIGQPGGCSPVPCSLWLDFMYIRNNFTQTEDIHVFGIFDGTRSSSVSIEFWDENTWYDNRTSHNLDPLSPKIVDSCHISGPTFWEAERLYWPINHVQEMAAARKAGETEIQLQNREKAYAKQLETPPTPDEIKNVDSSCASLGITIDAAGGSVSFNGTPLGIYPSNYYTYSVDPSTRGSMSGTLVFSTPLTVTAIKQAKDALAAKAAADAATAKAAADAAAAKAAADAAAAKAAADLAASQAYSCSYADSGMSYPACITVSHQGIDSCGYGSRSVTSCPTSNLLGTCVSTTSTTWWYKSDKYFPAGSITVSDVQPACTGSNYAWVPAGS